MAASPSSSSAPHPLVAPDREWDKQSPRAERKACSAGESWPSSPMATAAEGKAGKTRIHADGGATATPSLLSGDTSRVGTVVDGVRGRRLVVVGRWASASLPLSLSWLQPLKRLARIMVAARVFAGSVGSRGAL